MTARRRDRSDVAKIEIDEPLVNVIGRHMEQDVGQHFLLSCGFGLQGHQLDGR
jgi:hypothetical protein